MNGSKEARKLIHTELGRDWLNQFERVDQEAASTLANSLTLVSHNEFERNLITKMEQVSERISAPIAFYAVKELNEKIPTLKGKKIQEESLVSIPYFQQVQVSEDRLSVIPLGSTADVGSEGRVVSIIRQFCKRDSEKYLNHPTLESMKVSKCRAIVFVDDFIGSGNRAIQFIDAFWADKSIVSWHSYKLIEFHFVSYSGVESGLDLVKNHKAKPGIHTYRDAPTFHSMPWSTEKKEEIYELCRRYGKRADKRKNYMWLGYRDTMCALIFEHGCPNNVPLILYKKSKNWTGLFPDRLVDAVASSIFPSEIPLGANIRMLDDFSKDDQTASPRLYQYGERGAVMLSILALIAKGQRKRATLCFATGLNNDDCDRYLSDCIRWGFITPQKRITRNGLAEINAAKKGKENKMMTSTLEKGLDYYYPQQLRRSHSD